MRMQVLTRADNRTVYVASLGSPADFGPPPGRGGYPCLIWDHSGTWSVEQVGALAEALLADGCRYAVCAGKQCERWHDIIDEVFVQRHLDQPESVSDAEHVMTSWHDGEPPDDVAFFFILNTNFDDLEFDRYVLLHIGQGSDSAEVDARVIHYAIGGEVA
jgi:hypothetical protein